MTEMRVVAGQVVEFFVLMAVGFAGAKCKVLTRQSLEGIMKLIVKILLPCLICKVVLGSGQGDSVCITPLKGVIPHDRQDRNPEGRPVCGSRPHR